MRPRLVDLSRPLAPGAEELLPVEIDYVDHREGAGQMAAIFGCRTEVFPDRLGWASERVTAVTHAGTHLDAPWHYGPRSGGRPARTVDQIPLEWCYGPGVIVDLRAKEDGSLVTVDDLRAGLADAGHRLSSGDIVLLRTGAGRHWGSRSYPDRGCGLGRDSVLWLTRRGVQIIGTDAWGLDRPFAAQRRDWAESGRAGVLWSAHFAGRDVEYCQLEKLANLERLPRRGFTVVCFPIKIERASAAWSRVVALIEDGTSRREP